VKYIFTQIGAGEKIGFTSFVTVLVVICIYTIVFGRFFCGFACAFGSLGDLMRFLYVEICKKCKKKPLSIPPKVGEKLSFVKYVVLVAIICMCFGQVYSKTQGSSPWDVFSLLQAGNFRLKNYIPGLVILVLILVGMCLEERFFCRFLCPMGAVFSLLPVLPVFSLVRERSQCINGCRACTRKCPSNIELPENGHPEMHEDCFQCQKCMDTCPRKNVHTGIRVLRGNEIWFTILRAALLFVLFMYLV
jgi:polyferredoxin